MNLVSSYFLVRRLSGAIQLGVVDSSSSSIPATAAARRQKEYVECLWRNAAHPGVQAIHLLVEGRAAYNHLWNELCSSSSSGGGATATATTSFPWTASQRRKIIPILRFGGPPTYADLFAYASQVLPRQLVMVCNADVYLSPTAFAVRDAGRLVRSGPAALALTRYERDDGPPRVPLAIAAPLLDTYRGSHDAFVVVPPLPRAFIHRVDHRQNCYQAENIVVHELRRSCGLTVVNPSMSLRIVHRHDADVRQWFPSVDPERYGRATPCTLHDAHLQLSGSPLNS
eukprot:gene6530-4706_t